MSIIQSVQFTGFTKVNNTIIHDKNLSIGARLTLIHMLSKPSTWKFYIEVMAKEIGLNKDTVSSYVQELIHYGYVQRTRKREQGKFAGWNYTITTTSTISESAVSGELVAINTDLSNKEKQEEDIKEYTETQHSIVEIGKRFSFSPSVIRLCALRSENIQATHQQVLTAYTVLKTRLEETTQPRILSIPAYFASTLKDEVERPKPPREKYAQNITLTLNEFLFYNWLEEDDSSYKRLIQQSPLYNHKLDCITFDDIDEIEHEFSQSNSRQSNVIESIEYHTDFQLVNFVKDEYAIDVSALLTYPKNRLL